MFESDDFDQVLSQYDFPEITHNDASNEYNVKLDEVPEKRLPEFNNLSKNRSRSPVRSIDFPSNNLNSNVKQNDIFGASKRGNSEPDEIPEKSTPVSNSLLINRLLSPVRCVDFPSNNLISNVTQSDIFKSPEAVSPKHLKRKMINSFFDTKSKRKFPGPAGLLTGSLEESTDDNICHIELLSQDIDFSDNHLRNLFESPLWHRLQQDIRRWDLGNVDLIKSIKEQALAGHLRRQKAQTVTAFVETVDRSATDPLVILRDSSGNIKCTLHRDAWLAFSSYIASECCALILWKPTVLTTGSAYKKHYLNITLSNIYAVYSSAVLKTEDDVTSLPDGYQLVYSEEFTVIKTENSPEIISGDHISIKESSKANDDALLDGLDSSIFVDDIF